MKYVDADSIEKLPGKRLGKKDFFSFHCHSNVSCFNQCCRNLNLFLYPYDLVRLKNRLNITSDHFLDQYVDVVMRKGNFFPDVLLKMRDNEEKTCPFLTDAGCSVYPDRPDTCRTFPVEKGALFHGTSGKMQIISFFRPPDFCMGKHENRQWTTDSWARDQNAVRYNKMTAKWSDIRRLFRNNPFGSAGIEGSKGKMAFMTAYNIDQFREFIFKSSFLKRYNVKKTILKKARTNDTELLKLGFEWIRLFLWGEPVKNISLN